jgi:hypothetical protein
MTTDNIIWQTVRNKTNKSPSLFLSLTVTVWLFSGPYHQQEVGHYRYVDDNIIC